MIESDYISKRSISEMILIFASIVGMITISDFHFEESYAYSTKTITIASGSGTPDCANTKSCFLPSAVTVNQNTKITWVNSDSAAHTVTSGNSDPDGKFDSSLLMAGKTFSHTFRDVGYYDYFCMVHPWAKGSVNVIGNNNSSPKAHYPDTSSSTGDKYRIQQLQNTIDALKDDYDNLQYMYEESSSELAKINTELIRKDNLLHDKEQQIRTLNTLLSKAEKQIENLNLLVLEQLKTITNIWKNED